MTILLLYPALFLFMLWVTLGKHKNVTYRIILYFFLIGAISACYIRFLPNMDFYNMPLSVVAIVYHCAMLFLLIYPFKDFKRFESRTFQGTNSIIMCSLIAVIIPISLYYIYESITSFDYRMIFIDVYSMRQDLIDAGEESGTGTFNTYIHVFVNGFHGLALSIAFYLIIKKPEQKLLIGLLLLCSMAQVIHSLNVAAREFIPKYFFVIVMLCLLFRKDISQEWKRTLMKIMFIGLIIGLSFFVIVTIYRFTQSERYSNPTDSIFAYLGQGFVNFSHRFIAFPEGATEGQLHFPIFAGTEKMSSYNLNQSIRSDYYLNMFSTTVGSWVLDIGILFTTIAVLAHFFLFRLVGKLKLNIFTLYYVIYAYEFIFSCLFFYNDTIGKLRLEILSFIILLDILNRYTFKRVIPSKMKFM